MPAGKSVAPGRRPTHDMFGLCLLPKRKIGRVVLFVLGCQIIARGGQQVFQYPARNLAVSELLPVFAHVKIHRAVLHVGHAGIQNLLDKLYLLDDMPRSQRFDTGAFHSQHIHERMVAVGVILRHFHRLQLFQAGFLGYLVFPFVGIVLQMPHIGDVPHVAHLVTEIFEIAENDIESNRRTGMTQMRVTIYGRPADIHSHQGRMQRFEGFFLTRNRVGDAQLMLTDFCFHFLFFFCRFSGKHAYLFQRERRGEHAHGQSHA